MSDDRIVNIVRLGETDYSEAIERMNLLQKQRINDEIDDTLLILSHPEVVTIGPRARNDGVKPPASYDSVSVDRGGGLTWHGPGQVVFYPIFKWDLSGEDSVAKIISLIESWVINSLEILGIKAHRDDRMQGVWVENKKICSIGLSFLRWTSKHGFTINFDTPTGRVEGLQGCGLGENITTSLSTLGYQISHSEIVDCVIKSMEESVSRKHSESSKE